VLIFCNHGHHAGASIDHPHSQLVVLPFQINLDTLTREPYNNIVADKKHFTVYCPDFSQWPYELWISPKREGVAFGATTDDEMDELVEITQKALLRMQHIHDKEKITDLPFGYNYYIYPKTDWYLRIIPRFVHRAGFELGTGLAVNSIDPVIAAKAFKGKI
jgi:UDPglucose--hexose-1-phosphate uridylyltransferase